jgi:hypothetical protein
MFPQREHQRHPFWAKSAKEGVSSSVVCSLISTPWEEIPSSQPTGVRYSMLNTLRVLVMMRAKSRPEPPCSLLDTISTVCTEGLANAAVHTLFSSSLIQPFLNRVGAATSGPMLPYAADRRLLVLE